MITNELRSLKKLLRVHQSSAKHWVGNGFPVRSVFDYNGLRRELSPFLLLDYAAPHQFPPVVQCAVLADIDTKDSRLLVSFIRACGTGDGDSGHQTCHEFVHRKMVV
jgi:hypothetical protein